MSSTTAAISPALAASAAVAPSSQASRREEQRDKGSADHRPGGGHGGADVGPGRRPAPCCSPAHSWGSESCQLAGEVIEPERAERQRGHVPRLEIEIAAAGRNGSLPPGQPGALAQLVADRLARRA